MQSMVRIEIVTTRKLQKQFYDLPARLYEAFPEYEPPLAIDRKMMLDPRQSATWERASVRYWLAFRGDEPVGRISAQADPAVPVGIDPGTGAFGCLDAIDDGAVVAALVEEARRWLAEQGCTGIYGPCTLTMNEEPGMMIEGHREPAMTMAPWHPPYLPRLIESLGFAKMCDLYNWRLDLAQVGEVLSSASLKLGARIPDLRIRHPEKSSFDDDIRILCDVYNDGWRDHWGFVPLTPRDLEGVDQLMKWLVPPQAFKIVEVKGEPVAVMLVVPNLFELTHSLKSRPSPLGWGRLAWRMLTHRFRSGKIIVFGVIKRLQGSVTGAAIAALLVDQLINDQSSLKGSWIEAGWVLENNRALNQMMKSFNFERVKTFRIYGQAIGIGS